MLFQSQMPAEARHKERGRSRYIVQVKCQISWSLDLYKKIRHLDPFGQDIARAMQSLCSNFVYTLHMEVEEAYLFSNSKVTVQGHWTFITNSGTWIIVGRIYQELCSLRTQT